MTGTPNPEQQFTHGMQQPAHVYDHAAYNPNQSYTPAPEHQVPI